MVGRRRLLAAVSTGVVATAGCRGALTRGERLDGAAGDAPGSDGGAVADHSLAASGRPSDVCEQPIGDSDIVAVEDPSFASEWPADVDPPYRPLRPDSTVVGVALDDGRARAYPLSVLAVNEVVNDAFGGPLLVSFCPLCRSAFVAERTVAGEPTVFDVTGTLWRPPRLWTAASEEAGRVQSDRERGVGATANLVMYDRATESYWSQLLGQAICGPRRDTRLAVRAFAVTTWRTWRRDHPDGEVLLPPARADLTRPDDA